MDPCKQAIKNISIDSNSNIEQQKQEQQQINIEINQPEKLQIRIIKNLDSSYFKNFKKLLFLVFLLSILVAFYIIRQIIMKNKIIVKQPQNKFDELPLTYRAMPYYWGLFEDLTLLDIQAKGSHNSFDQSQSLTQQLQINSTQPYDGGCINIELDIFPFLNTQSNSSNLEFSVQHLKSDVKEKDQQKHLLSKKLQQIDKWHNKQIKQVKENKFWYNFQHKFFKNSKNKSYFKTPIQLYETYMYPIILNIDIKESEIFYKNHTKNVKVIDDYIKKIIPIEKIYTPKDMLMQYNGLFQHQTLIEIVKLLGFPKLSQLMGKYIIIITGKNLDKISNDIKNEYSKNPIERLGFVDIDSRILYNNDEELKIKLLDKLKNKKQEYDENMIYKDLKSYVEQNPNNIFLNQKLVLDDNINNFNTAESILDNLQQAKDLNIFVRGWFLNTQLEWDILKVSNINVITTDNVFDTCWTVLNEDYLNKNCQQKQIVKDEKSVN